MFSDLLAVGIENTLPDGYWLTDINVTIDRNDGLIGIAENQEVWYDIAPSQLTCIRLRVKIMESREAQACAKLNSIGFFLTVRALIHASSGRLKYSSISI